MQKILFELIQVALGLRQCLSHSPSADEWGELYSMAMKQSLIGVCFAGVHRLKQQRMEPPKMLYVTWLGMAVMIQQGNEVLNRHCVELQAKLSGDGVRSCVLKGQGVAQLYDTLAGLRQPGDIDVWVDTDEEGAMRWVKKYQRELDFDYKHVYLNMFDGISVEVHYRPSISRVPWYMRRVEQFTRENTCWTNVIKLDEGEINIPLLNFNLVFILQHIFEHLFAEEMTLKQYLDYYFVLKQAHKEDVDTKAVFDEMKQIGLAHFAEATMFLLHEVFGMPEEWMICKPDADEGHFLLKRVMAKERIVKSSKHRSVRWHLSVLWSQQSKNLHLLIHYPIEVLFFPIWLVRHFFWKRMWKMNHKELFV